MQYGTSVSGAEWDALMRSANRTVIFTGQRARVTAVINSERMQRCGMPKYQYVINAPYALTGGLCGELAPNGKPCLVSKKFGDHYRHISLSNTRGMMLAWNYCSLLDHKPVKYSTSIMLCNEVIAADAVRMGVPDEFCN